MAGTIQRTAQEPEGCGRFSSPLRKRRGGYISPFIGGHSLSLAFARQLPQGGSRGGVVPFNRVLAKIRGCGRFSSPLRNSEIFMFHHSSKYTPSVSHSLDSSLREGAGNDGGCAIQCAAQKPQGFGRFSSPLRRLRNFYIPPFGGGGNNLLGRLVKIFEKYLTNGQMCASIAPSIFESGLRRQ